MRCPCKNLGTGVASVGAKGGGWLGSLITKFVPVAMVSKQPFTGLVTEFGSGGESFAGFIICAIGIALIAACGNTNIVGGVRLAKIRAQIISPSLVAEKSRINNDLRVIGNELVVVANEPKACLVDAKRIDRDRSDRIIATQLAVAL
jgi:ABC-type antimicrobial peptide transport system ATPase subunit